MFDLIVFSLIVLTVIFIYITVRFGKQKGCGTSSVKKKSLVVNLLNYLPAILLLPSYMFFITKYFTQGYIIKYVSNVSLFILGVLLLIMALFLYSDSIFHMGKMWTIGLELRKDHKVIKTHAYQYVRHPIYTAWFFIVIASAIILHSLVVLSFVIPVYLWYNKMAIMEEKFLAINLNGYSKYMKKTKKFIPFIY